MQGTDAANAAMKQVRGAAKDTMKTSSSLFGHSQEGCGAGCVCVGGVFGALKEGTEREASDWALIQPFSGRDAQKITGAKILRLRAPAGYTQGRG
jgi:hypothetical protein